MTAPSQDEVLADRIVALDDGRTEYTKTRSRAWDLGGHTAVVLLEGRTGGYALDRVSPVS